MEKREESDAQIHVHGFLCSIWWKNATLSENDKYKIQLAHYHEKNECVSFFSLYKKAWCMCVSKYHMCICVYKLKLMPFSFRSSCFACSCIHFLYTCSLEYTNFFSYVSNVLFYFNHRPNPMSSMTGEDLHLITELATTQYHCSPLDSRASVLCSRDAGSYYYELHHRRHHHCCCLNHCCCYCYYCYCYYCYPNRTNHLNQTSIAHQSHANRPWPMMMPMPTTCDGCDGDYYDYDGGYCDYCDDYWTIVLVAFYHTDYYFESYLTLNCAACYYYWGSTVTTLPRYSGALSIWATTFLLAYDNYWMDAIALHLTMANQPHCSLNSMMRPMILTLMH